MPDDRVGQRRVDGGLYAGNRGAGAHTYDPSREGIVGHGFGRLASLRLRRRASVPGRRGA